MAVAIPDTYDYGRVIPQAQTAVTGYKVADAPVLSDAPAKALASVGQDLKEVAADTEKWSLSLDSTMAQDALNKLRAKRSDLTVGEDGFLKVRGGDVLKKGPDGRAIYDVYPERLQSQFDAVTEGSNLTPRARRMLQTAAQTEITGFKTDLARHGLSESEKYQAAVFVDTKSTLTDRAIQNLNDPAAFEENLSRVQSAVRTRAAQLGVPSEAMEKAAVSDVVKFGVMKMIATGDNSAIGFYEKYKDRLDPKDSMSLDSAIKTMRTGVDAKDWVASNSAPSSEAAKAGVKTSMQHWTTDGYSAPVAAGITAGFLRESQFNGGAVNKGDGRDGSDSISIGQWNGARGVAYKNFAAQGGMDPRDPKTGLAYAKAEIDGVIPYSVSGLSPDFKAKLQAAKSEKEAADIMTRGYFRPKYTEGESAIRQGSASAILAQYSPPTTGDPALDAVNVATGMAPPARPSGTGDAALDAVNAATGMGAAPDKPPSPNADGIVNARQMLIEIEQRKVALTQKAQAELSGNNDMLQKTLHEIEANYTRQKAGVQLYKDQLYDAVQQHMNTGGPNGGPATSVPPANIFSQLTWEQQQSIEKQVERNIAGKKTVTNWPLWDKIHQGLTSRDPAQQQMWADMPLGQFKGDLADDEYKGLAGLQAAIRKGDPDGKLTHAQTVDRMIKERLGLIGVATGEKASSDDRAKELRFTEAVQSRMTAFEKGNNGKKAQPEDISKILRDLTYEVSGTWTLGHLSNRRVYEVPNPDPSKFVVRMTDIPKSDMDKITAALKAEGVPATDENVIKRFKQVRVQ